MGVVVEILGDAVGLALDVLLLVYESVRSLAIAIVDGAVVRVSND